jgi:hypothetical protein
MEGQNMNETNRTEKLPPVIELGGRSWELRLTHSVMMLFSSSTRCPLYELPQQVMRYDYMVQLLWHMLQEQDGQLKREKFDGWLAELGVNGVVSTLMEPVTDAVMAAFPEDEDDEGAEEDAEADPT